MNEQFYLIFIGILIFPYDLISSQTSEASAINDDDGNKTCHEGLVGSQSVGNIELRKEGCTLLCTILSSSTSDYSGYYDHSVEKTILRSNTFCRDDEHVSLYLQQKSINTIPCICITDLFERILHTESPSPKSK